MLTFSFYKQVPFNENNQSVAYFTFNNERDAYLNDFLIFQEEDNRAFNIDQKKLLITTVYEALQCNYLRVKEEYGGHEWYYFVKHVGQIDQETDDKNGNTYELEIELDKFQTYFNYKVQYSLMLEHPTIINGTLRTSNDFYLLRKYPSSQLIKGAFYNQAEFYNIEKLIDLNPSGLFYPIVIFSTDNAASETGIITLVVGGNLDGQYAIQETATGFKIPAMSIESAIYGIARTTQIAQLHMRFLSNTGKVNVKAVRAYIVPASFFNDDGLEYNTKYDSIHLIDANGQTDLLYNSAYRLSRGYEKNMDFGTFVFSSRGDKVYFCGNPKGSYKEISTSLKISTISSTGQEENNRLSVKVNFSYTGLSEISIKVITNVSDLLNTFERQQYFEIGQDFGAPVLYNEGAAYLAQTAQSYSTQKIMSSLSVVSSMIALGGGIASGNPIIAVGGGLGVLQSISGVVQEEAQRKERAAVPTQVTQDDTNANLIRLTFEPFVGVWSVVPDNVEEIKNMDANYGRNFNIKLRNYQLRTDKHPVYDANKRIVIANSNYYEFSEIEAVQGSFPQDISKYFIECFKRGITLYANGVGLSFNEAETI